MKCTKMKLARAGHRARDHECLCSLAVDVDDVIVIS